MKPNKTNTKENEAMMMVESINTYKKVLEDTEVNVCTGMTESEKKAYKLGIYNSFAVINDFIDQNLNEDVPHYTVLLRDDIKSEEFTIDDFKKWTESREHGLVWNFHFMKEKYNLYDISNINWKAEYKILA